jgi:hypothetical protein
MDDQRDPQAQDDATGPAQDAGTRPTPPETPPPLPYAGGQPFAPGAYPATFAGANDPTYPGTLTPPNSPTPDASPPPGGFPPPPAYLPPAQYTLPPGYIPPPAPAGPPAAAPAPAPAPAAAPAPAYYPPPAPAPAPAYAPPAAPRAALVATAAAPQPRRKSTTPLVVEAILAFFGIYGVGWIMAGKRGTGTILLILSVFWLISAATGTVLTFGSGIFFFGPANLVFLIISVYLLLAAMRRS